MSTPWQPTGQPVVPAPMAPMPMAQAALATPSHKFPWAPWLASGGALVSVLTMLMPWLSTGTTATKMSFSKFGVADLLTLVNSFRSGFGGTSDRLGDGGWVANTWLLMLVLLALVGVGAWAAAQKNLTPMIAYILAGLSGLAVVLAIWAIIIANTVVGKLNQSAGDPSMSSGAGASVGVGCWLFLLATLVLAVGAVLTVLSARPTTQAPAVGGPQMGGYPQHMQQQPSPQVYSQPQQMAPTSQPSAPAPQQWGQSQY